MGMAGPERPRDMLTEILFAVSFPSIQIATLVIIGLAMRTDKKGCA